MDATVQTKINELIAAAEATGTTRDEILASMAEAERVAIITQEQAKQPPIPALSAEGLDKLTIYLMDGGGLPDMQVAYTQVRAAMAAKDQTAFWYAFFLLYKALRKMYPHWDAAMPVQTEPQGA